MPHFFDTLKNLQLKVIHIFYDSDKFNIKISIQFYFLFDLTKTILTKEMLLWNVFILYLEKRDKI